MTEAETTLKMIETVDPADTANLNRIDALASEYLGLSLAGYPPLTTSRDALKEIRPKGWSLDLNKHSQGWYCDLTAHKTCLAERTVIADDLPTEELAELHAIVQAIEYDRQGA